MVKKLSIIIPCYNCATTLRDAVDSCYRQGLDEADFEIVLVNDCSTDTTSTVIQELCNKHANIIHISHEKNMGGGAARNTAVSNSSGSTIFCLDGDDILPDSVLPLMITLLGESNCDGVLFEETRFFSEYPGNNEQIIKNTELHRSVTLSDMFNSKVGFTARVNFLYKKEAYLLCGGYPEHHGFDTQTFGFRFLSFGLNILICPNTYYYHRRHEGASYFDRESRSGRLSFNAYLMYEDIFHLFSEKIKEKIINFPIFKKNILGVDNLEMSIMNEFNTLQEDGFFIKNYRSFLHNNRGSEYKTALDGDSTPSMYFTHAILLHKNKEYDRSISIYRELMVYYPESIVRTLNIQRSILAKEGIVTLNAIEKTIYEKMYKKEKSTLVEIVLGKIWRKITKYLIKITKE